jgi:hypothetical protein
MEHFNPGITLWGDGVTLPEYWIVGAGGNKITDNEFINNNLADIVFVTGDFIGTEITGNSFGKTEEEAISRRDNSRWYIGEVPYGVTVEGNSYKEQAEEEEKAEAEKTETEDEEKQPETEGTQEHPPKPAAEPPPECAKCEECNYTPEKAYAALFFITLAALAVMTVLHVRRRRR